MIYVVFVIAFNVIDEGRFYVFHYRIIANIDFRQDLQHISELVLRLLIEILLI